MNNGLVLKYFVLKPDGDNEYADASRKAIITYATSIKSVNEKLHDDLVDWVNNCEKKIDNRKEGDSI